MLYGAIYGDMIGAKYRLKCVDKNRIDNTELMFTRNTIGILAVARSLLEIGDIEKLSGSDKVKFMAACTNNMNKLASLYSEVDYGALNGWISGKDRRPELRGSMGAVMSIPCGYFEQAEKLAETQCMLAYGSSEAITGAKTVSHIIRMLFIGESKPHVQEYVQSIYRQYVFRAGVEKTIALGTSDSTSSKSIPHAVHGFLSAGDTKSVLENTINYGTDRSSQAAIACEMQCCTCGEDRWLIEVVEDALWGEPVLNGILHSFNEEYGRK